MSTHHSSTDLPDDPVRRSLVLAAGLGAIAAVPASAMTMTMAGAGEQGQSQASRLAAAPTRGRGALGARLQGVQHSGITVQNMDRAYAFYTEVLGGTEIMRDGDFQGDVIQNTLLLNEEIEARQRGVNPVSLGVPDLRGGAQRLDVRFIQFDNVVIELLQYRDSTQPQGSGNSFAPPQAFTSPAFPKSMHVCFYVREDVDFNQFVHDLEAEAARRGMHNVKANRIVRSGTDQERRQAPLDTLTNRITSGKSDGWSLIYAKGPEGEQLEFVQVKGQAKRVFGEALEARGRAVATTRS
ncbi:lactoylglutathione lyase [Telluria beijingensis]|uniref:lactoylglutathione lyase n=1 Tax=Telluria beijingensis TaxID=3068633 RepID=UPI0027959BD1|nr:lactoylglutathione lyase [Massilia sp. REN29]